MYGTSNPPQSVIHTLTKLGKQPLRDKREHYVNIHQDSSYWQFHNACQGVLLIAPAVSGMALTNGLGHTNCDRNQYGFQVYSTSQDLQITTKSIVHIYE
jgi:glutamine amidotransferase PdxT